MRVLVQVIVVTSRSICPMPKYLNCIDVILVGIGCKIFNTVWCWWTPRHLWWYDLCYDLLSVTYFSNFWGWIVRFSWWWPPWHLWWTLVSGQRSPLICQHQSTLSAVTLALISHSPSSLMQIILIWSDWSSAGISQGCNHITQVYPVS